MLDKVKMRFRLLVVNSVINNQMSLIKFQECYQYFTVEYIKKEKYVIKKLNWLIKYISKF